MTFIAWFPEAPSSGGGDTVAPVVPGGQSFTVLSPAPAGTVVGIVAATDNVAVTSMVLTSGNTGGAFSVDSGRVLRVASPAAVAAQSVFTLGVAAGDAAGNVGSGTVTVSVTVSTEPPIPPFNPTVTILPTDNAAAVVAAQPPGTHFALVAGTYSLSDVRPKTGMHFRGAGSTTVLEGGGGPSGLAYAFRAGANGTSDNVTIGNMKIQNYGRGTSRSEYGAIQAMPTDTVANQFAYGRANNWFVYDVELAFNSANGLSLSDNCTALRVHSYGHTVTGIGGDRIVGGLLYGCTLEANALNPATGAASNGANVKVTWVNADTGRTAIVPTVRPKAQFRVVNCTFNATKPGTVNGTCAIGMWFDLDCQDCVVEGSTFNNHPTTSIFWEGCNNGVARNNVIENSDGFGAAFGQNFVNAALCAGESTNITFIENTIRNSTWAMMNRMSNRTGDWYNSNNASFVNYAWPTSSGGVRYWLLHTTPIPSPTGQSNIWTGNNRFERNVLVNCNRVVINEGTNGNGQNTQGSTNLGSITFIANDYTQSPGILFHQVSNTGLSLAQWQALPQQRDN